MGQAATRLICPQGSSSSRSTPDSSKGDAERTNYSSRANDYKAKQQAGSKSEALLEEEDLSSISLPKLVGIPVGQEGNCVALQHPDLLRRLAQEAAQYESSIQASDPRKQRRHGGGGGDGDPVEWRLLYSTAIQGRSFPRLVRRITNAGPTLIVIQQQKQQHDEEDESGDGSSSSSRSPTPAPPLIIGGVTFNQWRTVAERSGAGQCSNPSATSSASSSSSQRGKQDSRFFGDEQCFVFRHQPSSSSSSSPSRRSGASADATTILRGRSNINRNFMYLFDEHPSEEDKIGLGMGGQVGYHAWYVDDMLETCQCKSRRCTTFVDSHSDSGAPEALHPSQESFPIANLEVYALDSTMLPPELRRELERKALVKRYVQDLSGCGPPSGNDDDDESSEYESEAGPGGQRKKKPKKKKKEKSILDRFSGADKAVLEMAGAHYFYSDDVGGRNDNTNQCAGAGICAERPRACN